MTDRSEAARPLGPADPLRVASARDLLPSAGRAGGWAGVSRLAELTRLDRLGLPVWQAVRPMGRALSVHQGKGATDDDARLGALLEAVESHAAESYQAEGPICRLHELPARERAADIGDFAADRNRPPPADQPHRWVAARDLRSGGTLHLPFDLVSLDLTRAVPSPFDRASNGIGAGGSVEEAATVALQELIERDAVTEWQAQGLVPRMRSTIDPETITYGWFGAWRQRLSDAAVAARFYRVPSLTGAPVVVCELGDLGKSAAALRTANGRACHPDPEIALFKALAEAMQGRATYIAGSRDDLLPSDYQVPAGEGIRVAFGLPPPPGMALVDWAETRPGPRGLEGIVGALTAAGCDRIALVELARPEGLAVVRAFVCGLASIRRRRRTVGR
ncbi:YcaO-like family protein [Sphingosinicella terrae]|uniref:YcaO-like family protein n=1 Tax=Sphingosinicella terrae TaxID=2172047 RepID=UPI000E0CC766|nr:YcaO-like family protein [Sphingosinicella terrae]